MTDPEFPVTQPGSVDPLVGAARSHRIRKPGSILTAAIRGARPSQATKNLFLYAAIVFAGHLFNPRQFFRVTAAFLLFTAVSGSIYLLNDIVDINQDREHPTKRKRPIASGELPVPVAACFSLALGLGGLILSVELGKMFAVCVALFIALQLSYCFFLKHVVLLDVFAIAAGFMLRTMAGGLVIDAHLSQWLFLCTLQLALFLGFGKRRQELVLLGSGAGKHRAILEEYGLPFLDQMINIVAAVSIVCYSVYSVQSSTARSHPHLWLSVPFVIYCICRYLYLVYQKGWGGAPDEVLLKDRTLQIAMALWFAVVLALLTLDKAGRPLLG